MIEQIFSLLVLLAVGVILVFIAGTLLHFAMKKDRDKSRKDALNKRSPEERGLH